MRTIADTTLDPGRKRRWVKPLVETVELRPTDDVLGSCWASGTLGVEGACRIGPCPTGGAPQQYPGQVPQQDPGTPEQGQAQKPLF